MNGLWLYGRIYRANKKIGKKLNEYIDGGVIREMVSLKRWTDKDARI